VVLVADLAVVLLRPSSFSLLFRRCFFSLFPLLPLSTTFFSLCSGFVEMLVAAAWGVAWTVVGLSSSSSLRFSSALFASVSVSSFCFSRGCCRLGGQWKLPVMLVAVERNPTMPHGGYEGGSGWEAR
jgi:hypothetical protein